MNPIKNRRNGRTESTFKQSVFDMLDDPNLLKTNLNYKTGDFLDSHKKMKCIVSDEKYAVFAKVTKYEGEDCLDCDNILVYSNTLKEKIATPIQFILNSNIQ